MKPSGYPDADAPFEEWWEYYSERHPRLKRYKHRYDNKTYNRKLLRDGWFQDDDFDEDEKLNSRILFYSRIGQEDVPDWRIRAEVRPEQLMS